LGKTYFELNQYGPAEQSLKRALELDPHNFNTYALLSAIYFQQKAIDRAITELEAARKVNPKSVGARTALGILHEKKSEFKLAQQEYETALAIDPNSAVAANNLAWLYCQQGGDMDKAVELARRAKQALPKVPRVSDTLAWIYYKRQLYDSAIPLLREAVREQPKDAQIRFHLAASLLGVGKEAEAREELDAALKLDATLRKDEDYKRIFER
jgi:Flp pilus assembly protein TadD